MYGCNLRTIIRKTQGKCLGLTSSKHIQVTTFLQPKKIDKTLSSYQHVKLKVGFKHRKRIVMYI